MCLSFFLSVRVSVCLSVNWTDWHEILKYWEGFQTGLIGSNYLYYRLAPEMWDLLCISPKVLVAVTWWGVC